jgi:uncharacterized protein (TIGR00255 family)
MGHRVLASGETMSDCPIVSMTGFGSSTFELGNRCYRITIKTVNHRHLNIRFHLLPEFRFVEVGMRALVRQRVRRGAVDVTVAVEENKNPSPQFIVDHESVAHIAEILMELADRIGTSPPSLDTVLRYAEAASTSETLGLPEEMDEIVLAALGEAVSQLDQMRAQEGEAMSKDIRNRLDIVLERVGDVESASAEIIASQEARLRTRIEEATTRLGVRPDDGRIATELVLFADRVDVTEETVRTRAHVESFQKRLSAMPAKNEELAGKRLDFLAQELGRELSTMASKCRDMHIAASVVDARVELERIREQIQNIA